MSRLDRWFRYTVRLFHWVYFILGPLAIVLAWGDDHIGFELAVMWLLVFIYYVGCDPLDHYYQMWEDS